jgi:hypothetical protein
VMRGFTVHSPHQLLMGGGASSAHVKLVVCQLIKPPENVRESLIVRGVFRKFPSVCIRGV